VKHHFDKSALWDLEKVFSSTTIREFDTRFTAKLFGYDSLSDYYTDARLVGKLSAVKVPTLTLNAEDDPFQVQAK
jgi:predicted alpha/beta-fold hydrolase